MKIFEKVSIDLPQNQGKRISNPIDKKHLKHHDGVINKQQE
jgi:hypothetical protein